jgi:phosphomannomutase/phosphoglucomutase
MEIFGSSGVRGIVGEELTPGDAVRVAQAAGTVLDADRVAIARDTRRTGGLFVDAAASGLASVGCDVDRVGIAPTPALQAYCEREGVPGVMVTASHNPPAFNGIKLVGPDGVELTSDDLNRVEARLDSEPASVSWDETGQSRGVEGVRRAYREQLLAAVDRAAIAEADLTVALDPGHGAGALTSPDFFAALGCTVKTVNAQPDGHFPGRNPEPVEATLGDLRALVRATDADLGVAHDGDADRAMFVDETGSHIEGGAAFAALAAAELEAGDTFVSAVNVSQRLIDVAAAVDAGVELTPIGSTQIITAIREREAAGETVPVAGEDNGGIFFPDYRTARDGAYTAARFLELLARRGADSETRGILDPASGGTASEVVAPYDDYHNVREDLDYRSDAECRAMVEAIEQVAGESAATVDTTDGYRLDYGDGWVLARPSGTEPVVRVYAEARDPDRASALADRMVEPVEAARSAARR